MKTYEVTITETLQMMVEVKAKNNQEAEEMVSDSWRNSEYILDAEHFKGVKFNARAKQRSIERER